MQHMVGSLVEAGEEDMSTNGCVFNVADQGFWRSTWPRYSCDAKCVPKQGDKRVELRLVYCEVLNSRLRLGDGYACSLQQQQQLCSVLCWC